MPPLTRADFVARLGRLDDGERAAFAADLLAHRGYAATASGATVRVTDAEAPLAVGRTAPPADGALAVPIRAADGDDVRYLDGADLHGMTLYAVDRGDADALCRRHLNCPLDHQPPPSRRVPAVAGTVALALVGLVAVVVVVGGTAGWHATPSTACEACDAVGASATPTPEPASPAPSAASRGDSPESGGVVAGHAASLAGRSYTVEIVYVEARNGTVTAEWRERARVASPDRYLTTVERRGDPVATPVPLAAHSAYVTGEAHYVLESDGTETDAGPRGDAPAVRARRVLRWTFDPAPNASVELAERSGFVVYRAAAPRDGWPGARNVTSLAFVAGEGHVVELRRRHRVAGTNVTAILELRYSAVGNTTVERPVWAREGDWVPNNETLGDP